MKKVFCNLRRGYLSSSSKSRLLREVSSLFLSVILFFSLFLGSFSCHLLPGTTSTSVQTTGAAMAGSITTGKSVIAASQIISVSGGTITVNDTLSPIAGLEIMVPAGSYDNAPHFQISYTPIESHNLGEDFNPITPLITVENGGAYSAEVMEVKIPVEVPGNYFAMGFFYDNATGKLEGIPLLAQNEDSITLRTRHFSNFLISTIEKIKLEEDIDSGFRPGVDDWEFTNYGSYIASGGHCAGQSMTAMWYYFTRPDGVDVSLYGRYDNNGNLPKTPDIWQDNTIGYRFASVIQKDQWNLENIRSWRALSGINDQITRYLFAYAIKLTGEPQMVVIWSSGGGGHAMIVYRIEGDTFYIADPNYPGETDRIIEYNHETDTFKPYHSGDNAESIAQGEGKLYETIEYWAKSAIVDYQHINSRWQEVKSQTIGNDKFPAYTVLYKNKEGKYEELKDGHVTDTRLFDITIQSKISWVFSVFRDGVELSFDENYNIELIEGNNNLGIYIQGLINKGTENERLSYVDFIYINVMYNPIPTTLIINPGSVNLKPGESQVFTISSSNPPENASYEWFVNSVPVQSGSDKNYTFTAGESGIYELSVKEWDEEDSPRNLSGSSSCKITVADTPITTETITNRLEILRQHAGLYLQVSGKATIEEWWAPDESNIKTVDVFYEIPEYMYSGPISVMPISWDGTGFYGQYSYTTVNNSESVWTISGTVSADGAIVESLTYTYDFYWPGDWDTIERTVTFSFAGIPIWEFEMPDNIIYGPQISDYIVGFSDTQTIYKNTGEKKSTYSYISADWSDGYIFIRFSYEN
ncbi:MAG TPA: hypothetical protein DCR71_04490 [Dehalococcoidia bacterium]|nr:hypothetical protein [Dehalococcoidia bacterium]